MQSVYEKLGGRDAVNAAVDIFYTKVLSDPIVNHFFTNIDMKKQHTKQKAFFTYAFGGPNKYTGSDMRIAHQHLNLKEEHFNAIAGHLKSTLEELNVTNDLISEVMAVAASTHDDVLNI